MRRKETIPKERIKKMITTFVLLIIFLLSSYSPGYALDKTKPNYPAQYGTAVNTHTGNLFYQRCDLYIPGQGLSIDATFSYNSGRTDRDWGFGNGWTFTFNMLYYLDGTSIIIERGDGEKHEFTWSGFAFTPPVGVYDKLFEYMPGQYELTTKHGIRYYFDDSGHKRLTSIVDRNNNTMTFLYTGNELTTITDPSGRVVDLTYTSGHLSEIIDNNFMTPRITMYQYDTDWNLVQVINPKGYTTIYQYGPWSNMTGITDARSNSIEIFYNTDEAVSGITCPAEGTFLTFGYDIPMASTTVTRNVATGNQVTNYFYDANGRGRFNPGSGWKQHQLYLGRTKQHYSDYQSEWVYHNIYL